MAFHEGEIAVQERTGLRAAGAKLEGAIHDALSPGAVRFLADVSTVAVSAVAPDGRLWASVWCGDRGLVSAPDADRRRVVLRRPAIALANGDPVAANLTPGARVGLLAIDFATRRRIRVNGTVTSDVGAEWIVRVDEAFGNCAMYIQRRQMWPSGGAREIDAAPASSRGLVLGPVERALIARADTGCVASRHPDRGLDVSHRGGPRGFIAVETERSLVVPDYPGNNMFTTLGNFAVSPHAGLAIVDFEHGRCLSLTGDVEVLHGRAGADGTAGTRRFWRMTVEPWVAFDLDRRRRWTLVEESPFNPSELLRVDRDTER